MNAGPKRYLIRVRWERGAYVSSTMPQSEAESKAAELEKAVFDCGDGPAFVQMVGYDGRMLRIRAREVIGIECNPHTEDHHELPRPVAPEPGTTAHHDETTPRALPSETGGTDFLRRQSARAAHGGRR